MRARLAALALLALLAAGCGGGGGGGGGSTGDAAALAPADTLAYLAVHTDLGSPQLESAQSVLDKFPIRTKVLAQIRASLRKQGVDVEALRSSLGPELDLAILNANGKTSAVGFTRPKDEKTFDAQLAKSSPRLVHTRLDGWTVFSDRQAALDAVVNRKANLADDAGFQAASRTVPAVGDAIATAYVSAAGVQTAAGRAGAAAGSAGGSLGSLGSDAKWFAAALTSKDGAFTLAVHSKTKTGSTAASGAGLADEIPSGSIVALSVASGGHAIPANVRRQLGGLSTQLGVDLPALVDALNGPLIAYVRPGLPLPEITVVSRPAHPEQAVKAVGGLLAKFAKGATPVPTPLDGGTLNKLDLGSIALYYGIAAGKLVVTDSANALAELKGSVGRLSGDGVFKDAKDAAGMPDGGQGFLFVDLKDALPAVEGFAQLANKKIPPDVEQNLKPLRSLLVFGSRDGDVQSLVAYLSTS